MKKKHVLFFLTILSSLTLIFSGCGSSNQEETSRSTAESTVVSVTDGSRVFTDSVGREVTIPQEITKIAPSGSLAQLVLYTSAPDLLVGVANAFSEEAQAYIPQKYLELPQFGQFYGKNASLNMEALSAAAPDVIIDIGETKETIEEDMDSLQEQLAIPVIFIEANLEDMAETYRNLGDLLGDQAGNSKLSDYCQKAIQKAQSVQKELKDGDKKTVYWAMGNVGLNTNAAGSFHGQILETAGAVNAAAGLDIVSSGGGTEVSLEQLLQWQPDYILAANENLYQLILQDETWQELDAVKAGRVYKIPSEPYNFLGSPPSVNRIIGIQWLGQLLYPEQYATPIAESVKEFYQLFYHVELTDEQLAVILTHAV